MIGRNCCNCGTVPNTAPSWTPLNRSAALVVPKVELMKSWNTLSSKRPRPTNLTSFKKKALKIKAKNGRRHSGNLFLLFLAQGSSKAVQEKKVVIGSPLKAPKTEWPSLILFEKHVLPPIAHRDPSPNLTLNLKKL